MSARRALAALAALALAGAWVLAATRLWRTSVPADLSLPRLDPNDYFSASLLDEAASFQRFLDLTSLLAAVAMLAALGLFAAIGARFVRESAAGRIGTGMLLGMLALAFVWLAQLPFGLVDLWWLRRHDITEIGYVEWLIEYWITAGGEFLFISLALLLVMALAGVWPRGWWVAAAPALAAVALAFAFVQPYLLPGLDRPRDPGLAADVSELASAQGIAEPDVRIIDTYGATEAPNAMAMGLGPSERVVLWDTLVRDFDRDETRAVLAHELAHLSRDHIPKTIGWIALFLLPGGLIVAVATRRRGGMREPEAVPLAVLVVAILALALTPLDGEFSQRHEVEADWIALETTREPDAAEAMFVEFSRRALLDPRPPGWSQALLTTHPGIMERIEMVEAWREREAAGD